MGLVVVFFSHLSRTVCSECVQKPQKVSSDSRLNEVNSRA